MSSGDYDFFYDETENIFEENLFKNLNPNLTIRKNSLSKYSDVRGYVREIRYADQEKSLLQRLMPDVVLDNILPFICEKKNLSTLAIVSKHFKGIIFSIEAQRVWNHDDKPFQFCIDSYCTDCKRRQKSGVNGVQGFLKKCPVNKLKIHCFITDIPGMLLMLRLDLGFGGKEVSKLGQWVREGGFLKKCPLNKFKIHCFITDIPGSTILGLGSFGLGL
jgi:hypothetical protein